jgi:hypothetical protein
MARNDEESAAMTELELGISLASLFKLWWNVGDDDNSPRFTGWMRLYFEPYLDGRTHETEAHPGTWDHHAGPMPMSLLANVCDCIQDFRLCPGRNPPELISEEVRHTLTALVRKFDCQTPRTTQWRFMTAPQITPEKNAAFYALLRRYAPLFPQAADRTPVEVEPVFRRGRRHAYAMPRPERWRLLPHTANMFLVLSPPRRQDDAEYDHWTWDQNVSDREQGVIEGEVFEWDEYGYPIEEEEEEEEEEGEEEEGEEMEGEEMDGVEEERGDVPGIV